MASTEPIEGLRAVLFDVYGTLLISASGDISLASGASRETAIAEALTAVGVHSTDINLSAVEILHEVIHKQHISSKAEYPEVDIREVWQETLDEFSRLRWIASPNVSADFNRLATEYEMRVNPVWPMPDMQDCLASIQQADLLLGIISNAQFFTPELFPALVGSNLEALGFQQDLCFWSYDHRLAKPGKRLYEKAAEKLQQHNIDPGEVLYIGNDMRNDIAPAAQVGFRTVLFAGDKRSLRYREGDPLVAGLNPDRVVTNLMQILDILALTKG